MKSPEGIALKKLPGPRGQSPLKTAREMSGDMMGFIRGYREKYGDNFQVNMGLFQMLVICEPEYVKHILQDNNRNYLKSFGYRVLKLFLGEGLLTSEGDRWLQQRRLAQPAFHKKRLAGLAHSMIVETEAIAAEWHSKIGSTLDCHQEMMALTMKIVAKALFSTDVSDFIEPVSVAIGELNEFAVDRIQQPIKWPVWMPLPAHLRYKKHKKKMDEIVFRIIEKRKQAPTTGDDLLAMLLEARDEDTGEGMSDTQLRDEIMTIFVAGHETTAVSMTWTWYLLAQNPQAYEKLVAELESVMGDRSPTIEDVPKLVYTRQIIDESMRLYPPAWLVGRESIKEDRLGPYRVPKGATILMFPSEIHRRADLWDRPEAFLPERFAPEKAKEIGKYVYFPFGGGPRLCIGNNFALMEMTLILAILGRKFRLKYEGEVPIKTDPLITLRPKGAVPFSLHASTSI